MFVSNIIGFFKLVFFRIEITILGYSQFGGISYFVYLLVDSWNRMLATRHQNILNSLQPQIAWAKHLKQGYVLLLGI